MSEAVSAGAPDEALLEAGLPLGSRSAIRRLSNGLRIVAAQVPEARQLRLVGAVGVGYLDEPNECRGLAHLLEHGLFLGSVNSPADGEFVAWVGEQGGRYNAHTDEGVTDVHLHLPPEAADEGLRRLIDLLGHPRLDVKRLAREVGVLDAEFRARLADPSLHRLAALGRLFRTDHPARRCHAGHHGSLGGDPRALAARLNAFHRRHYRTERMALAMLGPLPLEEQLTLLERHGTRLPSGGSAFTPATWRWSHPGALAWCPPATSTRGTSTTLELIWPFTDTLARTHHNQLMALSARLVDGRLSARLQARAVLQDLTIDAAPEGTGTALVMRLSLEESTPDLPALLAVCRQAPTQCLSEPLPPPSSPPIDLDAWPRRQACRLAVDSPSPADEPPLPHWLAGDRCRVLWRCAPETSTSWSALDETGTYCRSLSLPSYLSSSAEADPPRLSPPALKQSPKPVLDPASARAPSPGCLRRDTRLTLWWGGPVWPHPTGQASWCLGWNADPAGHEARLRRWHRRTLTLRQAAAFRGFTLDLASDVGGDWLMAQCDPRRIASLVEQAIAAWTTDPTDRRATSPAEGLLARTLLLQLETGSAHSDARPRLLGWASGKLGPQEAARDAEGFADTLAAPTDLSPAPAAATEEAIGETWLPPQGEERAVMLEVRGADTSPRTRWVLQLLAACHDPVFHHEMRQRHGFGYVAAVRYREAAGWPRLGYVVQSPWASVAELNRAIDEFLLRLGEPLARLDEAGMARLKRGLLARHGAPETRREAIERTWQALRHHHCSGEPTGWMAPWKEELAVLEGLGVADLTMTASALADGALSRHWWYHAPVSTPLPCRNALVSPGHNLPPPRHLD